MKWDTDNIKAPHTLRELGIDPQETGGVDVSTEAVAWLLEALDRGVVECGLHEDGDTELFLVEDANETMADASMAVKALLYDRDRLAAEVARLTEALEFYGDKAAWNQPPTETVNTILGTAYRNAASKMQMDRGEIARAAIAAHAARREGEA